MRILSWNVNGLRAVSKAGFYDWLAKENADAICLQEIKCHPSQLDLCHTAPPGYKSFWNSAEKPGYSGVAIYTKREPKLTKTGIGVDWIDKEGRVLTLEYPEFVLICAYFPNSQREHTRLPQKLEFCKTMLQYCDSIRKAGKNLVLCGDYNIAHREIDLANPKTNKDNAGFLPEERAWMDEFLKSGYVDTFRELNPEPGHYTWWSYRPGVRERNIGWRIDYHCVNQEFTSAIEQSTIMSEIMGSDHCPVELLLKL